MLQYYGRESPPARKCMKPLYTFLTIKLNVEIKKQPWEMKKSKENWWTALPGSVFFLLLHSEIKIFNGSNELLEMHIPSLV